MIVQAFCDAACRFMYFDVGWPGCTNDLIAYKQTQLYNSYLENALPDWIGFALDEAYASIGGRHFTPFTQHQLDRAYNEGGEEKRQYYQMRAYNHALAVLRIHIERAFGQLVRRWGILWKSSELRLQKVIIIIIACAKLYNICVDRWIAEKGEDRLYGSSSFEYDSILEHIDIPHTCPPPSDEEIMQRFSNRRNHIIDGRTLRAAPVGSNDDPRIQDMHLLFAAGIRITVYIYMLTPR